MGRLELPLPEMVEGALDRAAKDLQSRILASVPEEFRDSISVEPFRGDTGTGLAVSYDDRAESFVFSAVEYPAARGEGEEIAPEKRS